MTANIVCSETPDTQAFPATLAKDSGHQRILIGVHKEHVKGAADKAKGAVKETVGKAVGNDRLRAEGEIDKAKGDLHNVAGDVKDAVKKATR